MNTTMNVPPELQHIITTYLSNNYLPHFNTESIRDSSVIAVIGKRCSGKTTLIKDICAHLNNRISTFIIVNNVEDATHEYSMVVDNNLILKDLNPSYIQVLLQRQRTNPTNKLYLVVDNSECLELSKLRYFGLLLSMSRHLGITVILAVQSFRHMSVFVRQHLDYMFIHRVINYREREQIHNELFGDIEFDKFQKLINLNTQRYNCIVVNNLSSTNRYYRYLANPNSCTRLNSIQL